jgi:hypothetical protein
MTYDEKVAVATNREAGVITVVHLEPGREDAIRGKPVELDVGIGARPWAAVIGEDDDTAYVLLRGDQTVVRVTGLHDGPKLDRLSGVRVGADPTDIAITPSGQRLYVANWGEGTVSMITTYDLVAQQYTDLNFALAKTGALGNLTEASAVEPIWNDNELRTMRPGLAHPRALAITDNGDTIDEDEILYATEFFSQAIPGVESTDPDQQRQGFVYAISMETGQLRAQDQNPIALAPVATGFSDAENSPTFCFPNQLYAAATEGDRLYVTSLCASPRGPVGLGPGDSTANFRTLVHPAIFVVDTSRAAQHELVEQSGVLTRKLQDRYDADTSFTDARMPLIPNDIAVVPTEGGARAYVTALGADAVFPVDYAGEPAPNPRFIDLRPAGRLPLGIALSRRASHAFALVLNESSQMLSVVSLSDNRVVGTTRAAADPAGATKQVSDGHRSFATGLDIWSFQGRALSSCESCHPEGLSDQVVWRFPRGPRRTISTAGTYFPDRTSRRMLLWTANADEIHDVEAIARGVSGGVGGVLWNPYSRVTPNKDCRLLYDGKTAMPVGGVADCAGPKATTFLQNGLNGSLAEITRAEGDPPCDEAIQPCDINGSLDWQKINAYVASIEAPKVPKVCQSSSPTIASACLDSALVNAGKELFVRAKCAGCHGGPGWTVSRMFYEPGTPNNGAIPYVKPAVTSLDAEGAALVDMRGDLRVRTYAAGALAALNPPAASSAVTFRSFAPAAAAPDSAQAALDYLYGSADQINCVLRNVGTFPVQTAGQPASFGAITAPGVAPVEESRRNLGPPPMDATYQDTLALGKDGFNVPSLVGLGLGGPFYHAGNARTLEEALSSTFEAHHANAVFSPDLALARDEVRALVSYLLSIDDATESIPVPSDTTGELDFNPDLCAQFSAP